MVRSGCQVKKLRETILEKGTAVEPLHQSKREAWGCEQGQW